MVNTGVVFLLLIQISKLFLFNLFSDSFFVNSSAIHWLSTILHKDRSAQSAEWKVYCGSWLSRRMNILWFPCVSLRRSLWRAVHPIVSLWRKGRFKGTDLGAEICTRNGVYRERGQLPSPPPAISAGCVERKTLSMASHENSPCKDIHEIDN